jgi:GTP-binding protein
MKVNKAEIVISAVRPEQYPDDGLPHIALAGRSNVGKSSFINKMINRKALARTSSKPGKTQTLNFYLINEMLYFVDVPGYGYAKVSKSERAAWGKMIETYITKSKHLKVLLLIVDLRHAPSKDDVMMYDFLKHHQIPTIVVATKADKIPKGKWQKHLKVVKETLQMEKEDPLVMFSAEAGLGKNEAWSTLMKFIHEKGE